MARVVLIIDSDTGALVDAAGSAAESGRYAKFAGRLLSRETNPTLNYGANGGDTLNVSKNGTRGKTINLLADTVNVPRALKVNGKTVEEIALGQVSTVLGRIRGADNEITVDPGVNKDGEATVTIGLSSTITSAIGQLKAAVAEQEGAGYATRDDVAELVDGLSFGPDDTLEDVKGVLTVLFNRIAALADKESSSGSSSSSGSDSPAISDPEDL